MRTNVLPIPLRGYDFEHEANWLFSVIDRDVSDLRPNRAKIQPDGRRKRHLFELVVTQSDWPNARRRVAPCLLGSIASVWSSADYFRSSPENGRRRGQ